MAIDNLPVCGVMTGDDIKDRVDLLVNQSNDPVKGNDALKAKIDSSEIVESVNSLKSLLNYTPDDGKKFDVTGFYAGTDVGGGVFRWDASKDKADHNGGTVIAPEALTAWDGTQGDIATLLDWTGAGSGCFVGVSVNIINPITIKVPSAFATIADAIGSIKKSIKSTSLGVDVLIESGYEISENLVFSGEDLSFIRLISTDVSVPLQSNYSGTVLYAENNASAPRLSMQIDASSQVSGHGIFIKSSSIVVDSSCGIKNTFGHGLLAFSSSRANVDNSVFTGCARGQNFYSCITSWASQVSAEGADCTGSGYYGVQAAHAGALAFRNGDASQAFRHGIRASDAAIVDADGAKANNCSSDGAGASVRAWEGGIVNFINGEANNNQATSGTGSSLMAYGAGSAINARGATLTGGLNYAIWAEGGSTVNVIDATISSVLGTEERAATVLTSVNSYYGRYTPTIDLTSNVTSASTQECQWMRVGDVVTVSGAFVNVIATSAGDSFASFKIDLPYPSDISQARHIGGAGGFSSSESRGSLVSVTASSADDKAAFVWSSKTTSAQNFSFSFTYAVN